MPEKGKPGRKKRPRTTAEKLLMAEFSAKLYAILDEKGWVKQKSGKERAARALGVSRASFYNYLNRLDLASFEVLKRAHDRWGMNFAHIDFGAKAPPQPTPTEEDAPRQYVLPFIKSVRENDIEIVQTKPVRPDTLQLTVNIRFAG